MSTFEQHRTDTAHHQDDRDLRDSGYAADGEDPLLAKSQGPAGEHDDTARLTDDHGEPARAADDPARVADEQARAERATVTGDTGPSTHGDGSTDQATTADQATDDRATAQQRAADQGATDRGATEQAATAAADGSADRAPLVARARADEYATRWNEVKGMFVDEPRQAVQQADGLVGELLTDLENLFRAQRQEIEQGMSAEDTSTEDLRMALRRYRSFFDRLLSV